MICLSTVSSCAPWLATMLFLLLKMFTIVVLAPGDVVPSVVGNVM